VSVRVVAAVEAALRSHSGVLGIRLVGSRAEGRAHDLSDWDLAVATDDFVSVSRDLHDLLAPLRPFAEQWDRYSSHECYMLIFSGPTKVDLLFPAERRRWSPPWRPSPETLDAIDLHFWDWILWLEQKRRGGREDVLRQSLRDLYELMLGPMGAIERPRSVPEALDAYLSARSALEERLGLTVSRDLEREVRPALTGR
jgi:hypothetical protein